MFSAHSLLRPPPLRHGSRIAMFTPSFPGPALFPNRFARGVQAVRNLGFAVVIPDDATRVCGYTAGSARQRAEALMALFADPHVDAIVCTIGGFNSNALLPLLDYALIRNNPKIFAGYSDSTALLLGIFAHSGLITFHGPSILPEWGEFPAPFSYTTTSFLDVTSAPAPYVYRHPELWTHEYLEWGTDDELRPRTTQPGTGWRVPLPGVTRGPLAGGNIETINMLVGTPYLPNFAGCLLFLEATESEAYLPRLERSLIHLETAGVFKQIRGLLFGRCPDSKPYGNRTLEGLLLEFGRKLSVPVVMDVDCGHTDPKMTLPIGIPAELIAEPRHSSLTLITPAVSL
jgi:muramoyltetrapeptide carboxypeptidase